MNSVELINVSKYILDKKKKTATYVLYNMNACFLQNKINIILGESGAGKSFTLKVIAGLEKIDDGSILINGIDKASNPNSECDISYLSQSFALYPHMSIFDNIAYPLKVQRVPLEEIRSRVYEIATLLNIIDILPRRPKEASIGQNQRVALARALIKRPQILLLDEPLSNLDIKLKTEFLSLFKNIQTSLSITFIYVTHNVTEALSIGDNIHIIDNGTIIESGSKDDLFNNKESIFYKNYYLAGERNE